MLMEFTEGVHCWGLKDLKSKPDGDSKDDTKTQNFNATLEALGGAVVVDTLLNNWDRIAVAPIWTSKGNPANLIFNLHCTNPLTQEDCKKDCQKDCGCHQTASKPVLTLIDQSVTPIVHTANRQSYMDLISDLANSAKSYSKALLADSSLPTSPTLPTEPLATAASSVQEWVRRHAGIEVENDDTHVAKGIAGTITALSCLSPSLSELVDCVAQETAGLFMAHEEQKTNTSSTSRSNSNSNALQPQAQESTEVYCNVCDKTCKTQEIMDKHLTSSLHRMGMERNQEEEEQRKLLAANALVLYPALQTAVLFVKEVCMKISPA